MIGMTVGCIAHQSKGLQAVNLSHFSTSLDTTS
jgi:hypothetical protein